MNMTKRDRRHPHGLVAVQPIDGVATIAADGFPLGWVAICRCYWISDVCTVVVVARGLHRLHREGELEAKER